MGEVIVMNIDVTMSNRVDNGTVKAKFCKKEESSWTVISLELTKLQLAVIRKKCVDTAADTSTVNAIPSPALEWPVCAQARVKAGASNQDLHVTQDDNKLILSDPAMLISRQPITFDSDDHEANLSIVTTTLDKTQTCYVRPGVKQSGWDPAGGIEYLWWDLYHQMRCEVCKRGDDERCILICDNCNLGYHMYCLRPVVSNIPTDEWLCPDCSSEETGREGFEILVQDLQNDFSQVSDFLSLKFRDASDIAAQFKEVTEFLSSPIPRAQRFASFGYGKKKTLTTEVGGIHLNHKIWKHFWMLPVPELSPTDSCHSFATMVAAMKYCGVTRYSEELVYADGVTEDMNDATMESIETMSKDNITLFRLYKENLKKGVYPPVEVVYDDELGFTVRALRALPRHTILTEYVGEVTTIDNCHETNSDGLMILLDTGDPKTSLIIDPTNISNFARFLSGVNNKNLKSKRKANVRTRRFVLDGKARIVLFTSRQVQAGESLNYDYNAGNEGKSVQDIMRTGFYDTSKFL